jgi:uncharacterized protein (DUF305 family)
MPRQWTDEQRKAQAERARAQKPWKHSTGPKTVKGKKAVSQNALKHGRYTQKYKYMKDMLAHHNAFFYYYHLVLCNGDREQTDKLLRKIKRLGQPW